MSTVKTIFKTHLNKYLCAHCKNSSSAEFLLQTIVNSHMSATTV